MKIKNKWLLTCIAVSTIGFNTVEGRVPYAVAKAYLPSLFEVVGIKDEERTEKNNKKQEEKAIKQINVNKNEKKKEKNEIKLEDKKDEKEEKNEIKLKEEEKEKEINEDKKTKRNTEKIKENNGINTIKVGNFVYKRLDIDQDNDLTKKEKAVLKMIYTDEGQYRMIGWVKNGIVPETIRKHFNFKESAKLYEPGEFFETSLGFNVSTVGEGSCLLGSQLSLRQSFADKLFNMCSRINELLKIIEHGNELNEEKTEPFDEGVIKTLLKELNSSYNNNSSKDVVKNYKEKLLQVLIEKLKEIDVGSKGITCVLEKKKSLKDILEYVEERVGEKYISDVAKSLQCFLNIKHKRNKITRIIYLLGICDTESELKNIINSIFIARKYIKGGAEIKIKDPLVESKEVLYQGEYTYRPIPYSYSSKLLTYTQLAKNGTCSLISGSCAENLIRHLISIALQPVRGKDKDDNIDADTLITLKDPQSGITNLYTHTYWRDNLLYKIIDNSVAQAGKKSEPEEEVNNKKSKDKKKSEAIPQLDSGLETICCAIDIISEKICKENVNDENKNKSMKYTKVIEIKEKKEYIEKYENIKGADNMDFCEILQNAMNRISKKIAINEQNGKQRFEVKQLLSDGKYDNSNKLITSIFEEIKKWSGIEFGCGFTKWIKNIVVVYDNEACLGYVIGLKKSEHCEIIRVLDLSLNNEYYTKEKNKNKFDTEVKYEEEEESDDEENEENDDEEEDD